MSGTPRGESIQYQLFILALCIYVLMALAAESLFVPNENTRLILQSADTIVCVVFFGDFLLSLYRAGDRWRYLYTWGWIDLASSVPTIGFARWGRAARAARIIRVLRGVRATRVLGDLALAQRGQSALLAASLVAFLMLVFAGISILQVETVPESNIKTAEDAVWWALATMTTVGYGDRFPVTTEGRLIAAALMCAGVGLFGMFSGLLAAWFVLPSTGEQRAELTALREEVRQLRTIVERFVGSST
jgi:voltage-gated potassium channel